MEITTSEEVQEELVERRRRRLLDKWAEFFPGSFIQPFRDGGKCLNTN